MNTPAPLPPAQPQAITHYENFPVASWLCPSHLRAPIAAIYAFARTADDLADEGPASPAERLHDLAAYRADLQAIAAGTAPSARWPEVFAPLAGVLRSHHLPVPLLDDLLSAFVQDVEKTRDSAGYATRAELLDYCRRSANPVGRLLLHLYGVHSAQALRESDAICTALQLINFWQDLSVDIPRGRFYLPDDNCAAHGVDRSQLQALQPTPHTTALITAMDVPLGRTACRGASAGNCAWWCKAGCAFSTRWMRCKATACASGRASGLGMRPSCWGGRW